MLFAPSERYRGVLVASKKTVAKKTGQREERASVDRTRSPASINHELRHVKACLNKLRLLGILPLIDRDGIANALRSIPGFRPQPRPLSYAACSQILVRGDSGFCRDELMAWCEAAGHFYVIGMARNERLQTHIADALAQAAAAHAKSGRAERVFRDFDWTTVKSWSRTRRSACATCRPSLARLSGDRRSRHWSRPAQP